MVPGGYRGAVSAHPDLEARVRASGLRMTQPRRRILAALAALGHATPEQLAAAVGAGQGRGAALSTVYRNLEALTEAGLVRHTHLDHAAPSYHLDEHGLHLHLVCTSCGVVQEAPLALADGLRARLATDHGFTADLTHTGLRGECAACSRAQEDPS